VLQALMAVFIAAAPANARLYAADGGASVLTYKVVHKLHQVNAEARSVEAKALLAGDGAVQVMVRVPVASFRSGDANRDEHLLEVVNAGAHPYVAFKGVAHLDVPTTLPATIPLQVKGELDFNGVKNPETIPVTMEFNPDGAVRVKGAFSFSLDRYSIERPSLLFVKIDDDCAVTLDLVFKQVGP